MQVEEAPPAVVVTEEQRLEQSAQLEAALTDRVEREVQKVSLARFVYIKPSMTICLQRLDAHLEELVDRRVAEAVLEVTQVGV